MSQPFKTSGLKEVLGTVEPIAIIGIGCRFPQANSPEAFWQLLKEGKQAVTSIPPQRWSEEDYDDSQVSATGKANSQRGGFLTDVDCFDASFFGISDKEAQHIDPQQRIFLEVAWEAIEQAGIPPMSLGGSATGVFTGLCTIDYHRLLYRDFSCIGPHSGTGTTMSITANRLSYLLNLRGPSMAVDAACASALVAVHLACQSLRSRESNLCVAGGVNLILSPDSMISSAQTGLLSTEGACRPFDADADGYVRGEGCGVVILKRLSDALAEGNTVLALIRGSAINQDGLSNSLTAPNGLAQQALIQQALSVSGVTAKDIGYVEAHAVGTPLGDAIEFKALKKVLMAEREMPCIVGSVKPNIGHLEAASGMAGLIKTVLSLNQEEIPPQLNFECANSYVDLERGLLKILPEGAPWKRTEIVRLAGVSTFGFGGTNAHVIVEEAPLPHIAVKQRAFTQGEGAREHSGEKVGERSHHLLTISAKGSSALRSLAGRYSNLIEHRSLFLSKAPLTLGNLCFSANTGRSHFTQRLCIISQSLEDLQQQLTQFAVGDSFQPSDQVIVGQVKGRMRTKIVFHFPALTLGTLRLGKMLYQSQPVFRQVFDQVAQVAELPLSFEQAIRESATDTAKSDFTPSHLLCRSPMQQIVGAASSYAIAKMWQQWGINPAAVTGEGLGEHIAACIAGLLDIEMLLAALSESLELSNSLRRKARIPILSARQLALHHSSEQQTSKQQNFEQQPPAVQVGSYDRILTMGANRSLCDVASYSNQQITEDTIRINDCDDSVWPQLLSQLGALYVSGVTVDWGAFDLGYTRHRLPLPTYPFERSRYWFTVPSSKQTAVSSNGQQAYKSH